MRKKDVCEEIREGFFALLEGDLSSKEQDSMLDHLRGCPDCAKHWEQYRLTVFGLRSLGRTYAPEGLLESIRRRLDRPSAWQAIVAWVASAPRRRTFAPVAACLVMILTGVVLWLNMERPATKYTTTSEWAKEAHKPLEHAVPHPSTVQNPMWATRVSAPVESPTQRILPGMEELLHPFKALIEDSARKFNTGSVWREDLVLDTSGSEEVFDRIQSLVKDLRGQMFLMGIRHMGTREVLRSRVIIRVEMGKSQQLLKGLEKLGRVYHLFPARDEDIMPPDRLKISVLAVAKMEKGHPPSALEVSSTAK